MRAILFFLFISSSLFAQQETGLQFMRHVWQSNETNPAIVPDHFLVVGLGFKNNLAFTGPTYNQIISKKDGKAVIDVDKLIEHLEDENIIRNEFSFQTISAAIRVKGLTLSLGHSVKYNAFLKYPKTLPEVVWQGNAQFIGETIDMGNELQLTGYHEIALGAAYMFGGLTLGGKAKFLSGIADASTDNDHHSATLYTDPDVYQITLAGDYILNSTNSIEYNDFQDIDANFNYGKLTLDQFMGGGNSGFAFDIGARLEIGKLDIAASVLDIGSIKWDEGTKNYKAMETYQYDGLDFSQALTGGEFANFDAALDTLKELFNVEETSESYTTDLPRKIYASALYHINDKWSAGASFFNGNFRNEPYTAIAVGANAAVSKYINVGATYGYQDGSFDNLGLNLTFRLGPVQLFALTDNVIALLNSGNSHNLNVRIGGNLVIK